MDQVRPCRRELVVDHGAAADARYAACLCDLERHECDEVADVGVENLLVCGIC